MKISQGLGYMGGVIWIATGEHDSHNTVSTATYRRQHEDRDLYWNLMTVSIIQQLPQMDSDNDKR